MKKFSLFFLIIMLIMVLFSCDMIIVPTESKDVEPFNIETFDRLFDDTMKKSLTIDISQNAWDALDQSMLDYAKKFNGDLRADTYVRADVTFEDENGNVEISDVGLRTRGNLSRVRIQNVDGTLNMSNFKLSFDEDFGSTALEKNKKRTVFEMEELDMKFNRNDDSTYLTEKYSLDLMQSFDVWAAHTTLANLYIKIDGITHYYGVYTLFEPIDQYFLERRFTESGSNGNLYKSLWQQFNPASLQNEYEQLEIGIKDVQTHYRPTYDLKTNKKTNDTSDLVSFIENINVLQEDAFVNYINDHFDVDRFLRLLAVGVLLGNPDDYRAMANNYYLYHHDLTDQWTMIPYDYDHGMGQGWEAQPTFENYTIGADIYRWGNVNKQLLNVDEFAHPLVDKILNVESYQLTYESYLAELILPEHHLFSYAEFSSQFETQKLLYNGMIDDAMKNLQFDLRNVEWYMTAKIEDIHAQLQYYEQNPEMRGY